MEPQEWAKEEKLLREGLVFILLESDVVPYAHSLIEPCSNNMTEDNALIIGLQIAKKVGVEYLEAYDD